MTTSHLDPEPPEAATLPPAVRERIRTDARLWFPAFDGRPPHPTVVAVHNRPRCAVYRVVLDDGRVRHEAVVKIRLNDSTERRAEDRDDRPVLTPERTVSAAAAAQREYDSLLAIEAAFRDLDPARFGAVRPFAVVVEDAAVVMEYRSEPTLRTVLSARSRLRPRWGAGRPEPAPWHNAGAWLRRFHDIGWDLPDPLEGRLTDRDALGAELAAQAGFLHRVGAADRTVQAAADAATHRLETELTAQLPLAPGHGDYTAQNVFAGAGGRVLGFDPMPLWQVPVYEDIARFTIGIRLFTEQTSSLGLAHSPARLDDYERAFLDGYFGEGQAPVATVRAFQVLVLLDRWGAMVNKSRRGSGPSRRALRLARVVTASRRYRAEADRLTALLVG